MLPSLMTRQEYTRRRYPTVSDHGNEVIDHDADPALEDDFWGSIQPGSGTEDVLNRNGSEVVYTIFGDVEDDVQDDDIVDFGDGDYFVNGEPERWRTGILDHQVIHLSKWKG